MRREARDALAASETLASNRSGTGSGPLLAAMTRQPTARTRGGERDPPGLSSTAFESRSASETVSGWLPNVRFLPRPKGVARRGARRAFVRPRTNTHRL
jgi:hypothetical protein